MIDFSTYYVDLEEANRLGQPTVRKLYSAKAAYGLPDLTPSSWKKWIDETLHEPPKFNLYYRYRYSHCFDCLFATAPFVRGEIKLKEGHLRAEKKICTRIQQI
jgi:hypothetical protein